ncbi:hypothetical protein MCUN1_002294 [Malassezia cuniculi]|uniref:Queuosine 5'-phosphate N-glycosylase/hydrolase n=1 Tax=Malassezia cuniculi TaxID=948313 RepID=A0AAF0ERT2_9BASI|nr:hypothetical protein MCUN1_002294 [Malassezia cuniculi]
MPSTATVRAAAEAAVQRAQISIDDAAIDTVIRGIDQKTFEQTRTHHGMAVPLRFDTPEEHINFMSSMAMLNALSGYRTAFHEATGKGASDNMRRLALGLFLTPHAGADGPSPLSAAGMAVLRPGQLAEILGVSLHVEQAHPTLPAVTVGTVGGPLHEALDSLAAMCRATGKYLLDQKYASLGAYVASAISAAAAASADPIAELLTRLVALPGFADQSSTADEPVYIYKKAFLLIHTLITNAERIELPELCELARARDTLLAALPLFVDNVIPTLLVHWGVICNVPEKREITRDEGYRLRAAALVAGEKIVARARALAAQHTELAFLGHIIEAELDAYLWTAAKEPELRSIPRFAEKSTMY